MRDRKDGVIVARIRRTQAWGKEHNIEVGEELLLVGIEMSQARNDVARQADADDLEDGLEDKED